ncbi:MAG: phage holin family protein [Armatimonadetes bacterium]|nr:phage holin family protein [Armatimonadota bacterium]
MREFVIRWIGNAMILLIVANALHGQPGQPDPVVVHGFGAAFLGVALVTVLNLVLQPMVSVVKALGCLVNLITIGVFGWLVSFGFWALAFFLVGFMTRPLGDDFRIESFGAAAAAAFWMALGNGLLSMAVHRREDDEGRERER